MFSGRNDPKPGLQAYRAPDGLAHAPSRLPAPDGRGGPPCRGPAVTAPPPGHISRTGCQVGIEPPRLARIAPRWGWRLVQCLVHGTDVAAHHTARITNSVTNSVTARNSARITALTTADRTARDVAHHDRCVMNGHTACRTTRHNTRSTARHNARNNARRDASSRRRITTRRTTPKSRTEHRHRGTLNT